jgi:hypothetical protein
VAGKVILILDAKVLPIALMLAPGMPVRDSVSVYLRLFGLGDGTSVIGHQQEGKGRQRERLGRAYNYRAGSSPKRHDSSDSSPKIDVSRLPRFPRLALR